MPRSETPAVTTVSGIRTRAAVRVDMDHVKQVLDALGAEGVEPGTAALVTGPEKLAQARRISSKYGREITKLLADSDGLLPNGLGIATTAQQDETIPFDENDENPSVFIGYIVAVQV